MGDALWDCWVLRSGRRRSSQVHPVWIWPANPALLQVVVEDIYVDIDNGDGDSCDPPSPSPPCMRWKGFLSYTATFRMGDGGTSLQESKCLAGIFQQIVADCKVPMSFFVAKQTFPMQCQPDRSGILDCSCEWTITRCCVGVMAAWSWTSCASDFPLVFIASVRLIWYTWSLTPVTPPICNIGSIHVQGRSIELYFEHSAFNVALKNLSDWQVTLTTVRINLSPDRDTAEMRPFFF